MELKLNPTAASRNKISYAGAEQEGPDILADCSYGWNPYGFPPEVLAAAKQIGPSQIGPYPHGEGLKKAIQDFWSPWVHLPERRIILCDGSMGGIYAVNTLFYRPGAKVLSLVPKFSEYTTHAALMGYECVQLPLRQEIHYQIDMDELYDALEEGLSVLYLDRPHNPTGQVIPLKELEELVRRAADLGIAVLADEAYGEAMAESESALTLLDRYDNLMVVRSFSKGWGLAGLRAGYLAAGETLAAQLEKLTHPYMISAPSRLLAEAALSNETYPAECRKAFAEARRKLNSSVGHRLGIAASSDTAFISLVEHEEPEVDLAAELRRRGVLTISGTEFGSLGANSVRLRLPAKEEEETVFRILREIDQQGR